MINMTAITLNSHSNEATQKGNNTLCPQFCHTNMCIRHSHVALAAVLGSPHTDGDLNYLDVGSYEPFVGGLVLLFVLF
jgi:hypothetical protein